MVFSGLKDLEFEIGQFLGYFLYFLILFFLFLLNRLSNWNDWLVLTLASKTVLISIRVVTEDIVSLVAA